MKKPGAFYRRWEVAFCKRRIRIATHDDLPELRAALSAELAVKHPRKRLVPALREKIKQLESQETSIAKQATCSQNN